MTGFSPITFEFESDEHAVRENLERLMTGLHNLDLAPEDLGNVQIVMAEVLNNIVEHAYPDEADHGPIKVDCMFRTDGLHLQIEDQGAPMPKGQLPEKRQADLDVDMMDLPEGGFGWFLIHTLTRDLMYDRQDTRNVLTFNLPMAMTPQTASQPHSFPA